jgi:L-seryl-tRNA(Ser) seleniumtransferase
VLRASRYLERLRRHPLARALRVDKLTLAALRATLTGPRTPVWLALHRPMSELRRRAEALDGELRDHGLDAVAVNTEARVGGGGAPEVPLPSAAVSLPGRYADPPMVGRVERGRCLLDLRAVPPELDPVVRDAVLAVPVP